MPQLNRLLDIADYGLCRIGIFRRFASWDDALSSEPVQLYAGKLRRGLPQYRTHWGLTPFYASGRNIPSDVTAAFPIPNDSVDIFQSEDVFEHIEIERVPGIFNEIFRVLKPGGLFRLSLPDYNFDIYRERTIRDAEGELLFDPGGGGRLERGRVVDGGHVWFPTIANVRRLFDASAFAINGRVDYLHYTSEDGSIGAMKPIDYTLGHIQRTPDHDPRVADNPRPLSIVVDAWKSVT
jgi:SAM-dependent methyltransferase